MRPSAMFGLLNYRRRENRMLDTRHIYIELCLSLTKIRSAIDCHGLHNHPMDSTGKEECRAEMERVVVVNQHAFDYSKRKKNIINMPEHIQTNKIQLHSHCTCINSYMAWFAVHKLFHISVFFLFSFVLPFSNWWARGKLGKLKILCVFLGGWCTKCHVYCRLACEQKKYCLRC